MIRQGWGNLSIPALQAGLNAGAVCIRPVRDGDFHSVYLSRILCLHTNLFAHNKKLAWRYDTKLYNAILCCKVASASVFLHLRRFTLEFSLELINV